MTTAFNPIPPRRAVEHLELAGIPHAQQFMVNFATGGLLRTYARVTETIHTGGRRVVLRDATIPAELWRRIEAEGKADDACETDTARLDGSSHQGTATVSLIGIRINEDDVLAAARQHGSVPVDTAPPAAAASPRRSGLRPAPIAADQLPLLSILAQADQAPAAAARKRPPGTVATPEPTTRQPRRSDAPDPNALWFTVAQTMTLTNLGRTKVNELMIAGSFRRKKVGRRTLIERASVEEYMASR